MITPRINNPNYLYQKTFTPSKQPEKPISTPIQSSEKEISFGESKKTIPLLMLPLILAAGCNTVKPNMPESSPPVQPQITQTSEEPTTMPPAQDAMPSQQAVSKVPMLAQSINTQSERDSIVLLTSLNGEPIAINKDMIRTLQPDGNGVKVFGEDGFSRDVSGNVVDVAQSINTQSERDSIVVLTSLNGEPIAINKDTIRTLQPDGNGVKVFGEDGFSRDVFGNVVDVAQSINTQSERDSIAVLTSLNGEPIAINKDMIRTLQPDGNGVKVFGEDGFSRDVFGNVVDVAQSINTQSENDSIAVLTSPNGEPIAINKDRIRTLEQNGNNVKVHGENGFSISLRGNVLDVAQSINAQSERDSIVVLTSPNGEPLAINKDRIRTLQPDGDNVKVYGENGFSISLRGNILHVAQSINAQSENDSIAIVTASDGEPLAINKDRIRTLQPDGDNVKVHGENGFSISLRGNVLDVAQSINAQSENDSIAIVTASDGEPLAINKDRIRTLQPDGDNVKVYGENGFSISLL